MTLMSLGISRRRQKTLASPISLLFQDHLEKQFKMYTGRVSLFNAALKGINLTLVFIEITWCTKLTKVVFMT